MVEGPKHVADVAVRHRGKDRALGAQVLERLVGDESRAGTGRQLLHREEEQVRRAHEGHGLPVREQPWHAHEVVLLGDGAVPGRQRAGQMQLDPVAKRWIGGNHRRDCVHEEHV